MRLNQHPTHRFIVKTEIVFTTQQEMDAFDAEHFFQQELADGWEGQHDLDFESVKSTSVEELPADEDDYADLLLEEDARRIRAVTEALDALSDSEQRQFLRSRLNLDDITPSWGVRHGRRDPVDA